MLTGSFDPVTNGHIGIISRAVKIFDKVYAAVLVNPEKKCLLSLGERLEFLQTAIRGIDGAEASSSEGTAAELAKRLGADCFIRGIRNFADYEYESVMAGHNLENGGIDTLFFWTRGAASDISSGAVKRLLAEGKSVAAYVPRVILPRLSELCAERTKGAF
jgi:pantetheine-phosphate adenylyltransferase